MKGSSGVHELPGVLNPRYVIERGAISNYSPERIQGNSIDLRVNRVFRIDGGITIYENNERVLPPYEEITPFHDPRVDQSDRRDVEMFSFSRDHLYQVEFFEKVALPEDICAITILRSSLFKSGASGETGLFDSGYEGETGMSLNVKFDSYIERGSAVAQMIFFSTSSAKLYDGRYLDQSWKQKLVRD